MDATRPDGALEDVEKTSAADATSEEVADWRASQELKRLGHFLLGPEIGHGGMGVVYRAFEMGLDREVALKVLPPEMDRSARSARFKIEVKAAGQLDHENIVPVYHVGEDGGTRYFAMKLIHGSNLSQLIRKAKKAANNQDPTSSASDALRPSTIKMSVGSTARGSHDRSGDSLVANYEDANPQQVQRLAKSVALVGKQVADALEHAHSNGVIHRDIKPSNLLIDDKQKVWVSDFGLALLQDAPDLTRSGDVLGTLRYMSPEQASGRRAFVDHRTDVYSLGATLYEMATLRPMCRGKSSREILREITLERPTPLRKINSRFPADFETIISKATERNPADRYPSAAALAEDLQKFINGQPLSTKPTSQLKHLADWFYDRPFLTGVGSILVLLLLAGLSAGLFGLNQRNRRLREALNTSLHQRAVSDAALAISSESPGKSLAISLFADEFGKSYENNQVMMDALNVNFERKTISLEDRSPGNLAVDPTGKHMMVCVHPKHFADEEARASVFQTESWELSQLYASEFPITSAAFGRNGRILITTACSYRSNGPHDYLESDFGPVQIWDCRTGLALDAVQTKLLRASAASIASDESMLVLPGNGHFAEIIQLQGTGDRIRLVGHEGPVLQAIFDPQQEFVATWSLDGTAGLFDAASGELLSRIEFDTNRLEDVEVSFAADSSWLMLNGDRGSLFVKPADPTGTKRFRGEQHAVFAGDGHQVALLSEGGKKVYLYNPNLNEVVAEVACPEVVREIVAISGQAIVARAWDTAYLLDLNSEQVSGVYRGHSDLIVDLVADPADDFVATVGWDATLRIWNRSTNLQSRTLDLRLVPNSRPVIGYSPNGQSMAVGPVEKSVTSVVDILAPVNEETTLSGEIRVLLDDGTCLTADGTRLIHWNYTTLRKLNEIDAGEIVQEVALLQGQEQVVFRTWYGELYHWKLESKTASALTKRGESAVMATPHNAPFILAGAGETLYWYDVETLTRETITDTFLSPIVYIDTNRNATQAVVATLDGAISVWDLENKQLITQLDSGIENIFEAQFVLDDKSVIVHTGRLGGRAAIFGLPDMQSLGTHDFGGIRDLQLDSQRNECLVTTSDKVWLWSLSSNQLAELDGEPARRADFTEDYIVIASESMVSTEAAKDKNDSVLRFYNRVERALEKEVPCSIRVHRFVSEKNKLFFSGAASGFDVVDLASQSARSLLNHTGNLVFVGYLKNGNELVSISDRGRILIEDVKGANKYQLLGSHNAKITAACMSPDRELLITADDSGRIAQWDLAARQWVQDLEHQQSPVAQMKFGTNSNKLVTRHGFDALLIWDLRSMSKRKIEDQIRSFEISPDEQLLLTIRGNSDITPSTTRLFDRPSENPEDEADAVLYSLVENTRKEIRIPSDAVDGRFYDRGDVVLMLSADGILSAFDSDTQKRLYSLQEKRPFLGLPIADAMATTAFVTQGDSILAFDVRSQQGILRIDGLISEYDASVLLTQWELTHPRTDQLVILGNQSITLYPKDPVAVVERLAPRRLTAQERAKYILSP
ncbi:MAG: protein kinase [bacterium]|nr:protein kinase [bacterium]